jgi:very-short-patch-repair endonuclease
MCKELFFIIEVDGLSHFNEEAYNRDLKRQQELESAGYKVVRFKDNEVLKDIKNVVRSIEINIEESEIELKSKKYLPLSLQRGITF